MDYLSQRKRRHHSHRVGLEVVMQLASSQDYGVNQLLDVGVTRLSLGEHFADEVDRSLDGQSVSLLLPLDDYGRADHLGCRGDVE